LLERPTTQWGRVAGMAIALHLGAPQEEAAAAAVLGLCDLSALPKLGVKGRGAEAFLRDQAIDVPAAIYDTRPLADGGLIVRLGASDFFLEGVSGEVLPRLSVALAGAIPGVYRVERQDATLLLVGTRAQEVLAQVCSIDFRTAPSGRLILTRAAGVNCGILPESIGGRPVYRFWVDPTYAVSLWQMLAEIVEDLGGRVVGAACFYPDLT
jgi:sarcosine oxidase subunit gamma